MPFAAFSRRDWEMNTLAMDSDDYVFRPGTADGCCPTWSREYRGMEGYLDAMHLLLESWDLQVELIDVASSARRAWSA